MPPAPLGTRRDPVHRRFERNAERWPERPAVVQGERRLSYRELDARADEIARALVERGVGRGAAVGVCMPATPELVASLLGILKAGAAYAPLDVTYPRRRLELMIAELARMRWLVASSQTPELAARRPLEVLDVETLRTPAGRGAPRRPAIAAEDLCYVVFTSGTTGRPKATAVRHAGWSNLLHWFESEFALTAASSNLLVSAFGFDISQRSLMAPLFCGAALHLLPSVAFDPMMARDVIARHRVRTLHLAPSTLYLLLETDDGNPGALDPLDYAFIGGEALTARRVMDWARRPGRRCKLVHQYGVAECTDVATSYVMKDFARYCETGVPIGRPVANCAVHILNEARAPVPEGAIGEICISGAGVGAGYLNNEELNKERFVDLQTATGTVKLYRTGDLGHRLADGDIMCVGRWDNQVKIRGMRLDLGDVEVSLCASEHVEDAAVIAVADADDAASRSLVAFVIPPARVHRGGKLDENALRLSARSIMPRHMIPRRFLVVESFPLTSNGKVDRAELRRIYDRSTGASVPGSARRAPCTAALVRGS